MWLIMLSKTEAVPADTKRGVGLNHIHLVDSKALDSFLFPD